MSHLITLWNLLLAPSIQELVDAAIAVRENAYCPYSNFPVGAAIRTTDGKIYAGCNVENGAYGPTVCAERTAISKAVSEGYTSFTEIAVVAFQEHDFTSPCGMCRQFMSEFVSDDMPVYMARPSRTEVLCSSVCGLLPHRYIPTHDKK